MPTNVNDPDIPTKMDTTEARQARKGFGVNKILLISMTLAVLAMVLVWLFAV